MLETSFGVLRKSRNGSVGACLSEVSTSGCGQIHTTYRDPSNDYANSVKQQPASNGGGGAPSGTGPSNTS